MRMIDTAAENASLKNDTRLRLLRAHRALWMVLAGVCLLCGIIAGMAFAGLGFSFTAGLFGVLGCLVLGASLWAMGRKL